MEIKLAVPSVPRSAWNILGDLHTRLSSMRYFVSLSHMACLDIYFHTHGHRKSKSNQSQIKVKEIKVRPLVGQAEMLQHGLKLMKTALPYVPLPMPGQRLFGMRLGQRRCTSVERCGAGVYCVPGVSCKLNTYQISSCAWYDTILAQQIRALHIFMGYSD